MKDSLKNILEMHGRAGKRYSFFVLLMILFSTSLFLMEFFPELSPYYFLIKDFEIIFTVFFTLEYFLKIFYAKRKLAFLFTAEGIIDLLSILPFYLSAFSIGAFHLLHFDKLIRILKVTEFHHEFDRQNLHSLLGLDKNAKIEHIIFRHPIYILSFLPIPFLFCWLSWVVVSFFHLSLFSIVIAGILSLFSILFCTKIWLDFIYDVVVIMPERILIQNHHIIGKDIDYISYEAVTNVKYEYAGILGYLLGYGNIIIETQSTTSGIFKLHFISQYQEGARVIMQKLK